MPATSKQLAALLAEAADGASPAAAREAAEMVIRFLADEQRLSLVPSLIRAMDGAWRKRYGASHVHVKSAVALPHTMLAKLAALAPGADIESVVDPSLIGGAVIRIDDRLIDSSVQGTLARLKKTLTSE